MERTAIEDDLIDELQALGFGETEARVYLALLREHPVTGYQIGKASGMPRSWLARRAIAKKRSLSRFM